MKVLNQSLIALTLLLIASGCTQTQNQITNTAELNPADTVEIRPQPRGTDLETPDVRVIDASNVDEFAEEVRNNPDKKYYIYDENGQKIIIENYEQLLRYIEQLQALIIYYENSIKNLQQ